MTRHWAFGVVAAIAIGLGLRFVVNLEPVWWLAWILPGLLLAVGLRYPRPVAALLVALAVLIGATANYSYLRKVMPLPSVLVVMALQTLSWMAIYGATRFIVRTWNAAWTVLAFPVLCVALDTLLAHFTPDGNRGSLAYTQAEVLPVAQLASIAGVGGILFVLTLFNSAIGLALYFGVKPRGALAMYAIVAALACGAITFGSWRLGRVPAGAPVAYGIASIDDFIHGPTTEGSRNVWAQYEAQVEQLSGSGAKIVVLPEKIDVLRSADASVRERWLGEVAKRHRVWLLAGLGVDSGTERRNEAWLFAPDGHLAIHHLKHFLAPPEGEFVAGHEFPVSRIDGVNYGVAICEDMHFASLGRVFGARDVGVMLVPASDFHDDEWMTAEMTAMRGIENGFAVVRSSRDGLLSISDPYGRLLAVEQSAKLPGAVLFDTVTVGDRIPTIYTRMGDLPGWSCVVATFALIALSIFRARRTRLR